MCIDNLHGQGLSETKTSTSFTSTAEGTASVFPLLRGRRRSFGEEKESDALIADQIDVNSMNYNTPATL